tara:strand:+ start:1421 stop:1600 length:180 start_codon:yes stop_codon:yes gene_type:complete
MGREWYYISSTGKKDEQKRDVGGDREVDLVFSDDDRFTLHDVVPIVSEDDKEDDFDDTI